MKRLRAFGCSYTCYSWPTWADLLCYHFDQIENWAMPGIGNRAISEIVAEANTRHPFTKDDVVIVQWSSHLRNDFYNIEKLSDRMPGWQTAGSIFNYKNVGLYDKKWIETFFYEPAYFMHTLNSIALVQSLLESTECTWYMTSMGDLSMLGADMRSPSGANYGETTKIVDHISDKKTAWEMIPNLLPYRKPLFEDRKDRWLTPFETHCKTMTNLTYKFPYSDGTIFEDLHPSPLQSLSYIELELKDKLGIADESLVKAKEAANKIQDLYQTYKSDKSAFEYAISNYLKKMPEFREIQFIFPQNPKNLITGTIA
jgi:hypothetical protein